MFSPSLSRLNNLPRANDISMPGWAQYSEESEKKLVQIVVLSSGYDVTSFTVASGSVRSRF